LKVYEIGTIRNLALVGHQDTGKTTFLEAVLFDTKQVSRPGRVDDGNSNLDFSPEEIERRISIQASLAHAEWKGHKVNFIDTPGYEDFGMEVLGALAVVESALLFVKADASIEVGTERAWRELESLERPRFVVVNRMDKEHANFTRVLADLRSRLSNKVVPLHLPIGAGDGFKGWVDVVRRKAYHFADGGASTEVPIPGDLTGALEEAREALLNAAAETDDALTEKFLDSGELSDDELRTGLAAGVAQRTVYPVLVACGGKALGVGALLDAVVEFAPSPSSNPVVGTKPGTSEPVERRADAGGPLAALAFKTMSEQNVGDYTFVRVWSGRLGPGMDVLNASNGQHERTGPVYVLNGKIRGDIEALVAGDIGAVVKLKSTHTSNTLCDKSAPIVLPFPAVPEPLATVGIHAKGKGDEDKLSNGLQRLHEEDPAFKVVVSNETHQTLLSAQGDTHLAVLLNKLKRKYNVEVDTESPKTPYRETIKGTADERYRHKKQTGGRGQFGEVHLKIDPLPRGGMFEFVDGVVGGVIPNKFIPAVEKGVREAMQEGVIAGYQVVDVRVTVDDGKDHPVDSSEAAFKIAGGQAFKAAVPKAKPVLLEPIYKVEVRVPDDYMGDVMGDLSSRRGHILGMDQKDGLQIVRAEVPLAELYTYATTLRSLTQGRASHSRTFSRYEEVPREVAEGIIAEHKAAVQQSQ